MKKALLGILVAAVVVIALGTAGYVYAQSTNPQTPVPGSGYGRGMRGQFADADLNGPMHAEMVAAFAARLEISVADLNARLAKGETMAQIALSKGITAEQWPAVMAEVRSQALVAAVKNGTLTQAQADAMKQRGAGMMGAGTGYGAGLQGGRGMMQGQGARGGMMGRGQFNNQNCPMFTGVQ